MLSIRVETTKKEVYTDLQKAFQGFFEIVDPIDPGDLNLQHPLYPEASPGKWHMAHALGWFWERFVLSKFDKGYKPYKQEYFELFNSYYQAFGHPLWPRNQRALVRPRVAEVKDYAHEVWKRLNQMLEASKEKNANWPDMAGHIILGIQHLKQHQELLITDLLVVFNHGPIPTVYPHLAKFCVYSQPIQANLHLVHQIARGNYQIGSDAKGWPFSDRKFCWDNEHARHEQVVEESQVSIFLVTNRHYANFIEDHGYTEPRFWSSEGWDFIQQNKITTPMHWEHDGKGWLRRDFKGLCKLDLLQPVTHVSFYEATAYANWVRKLKSEYKTARLPTEAELEIFAEKEEADKHVYPNFSGYAWQWTSSPYTLYPFFETLAGDLAEYNGKFTDGAIVLKGGSVATPPNNTSSTFRNFWSADNRTQINGIRLAFNRS